MSYPKVIVLVLTYNNKFLLDDSLSSYLQNDYPNFEVFAIDNGSTDGTSAYIKDKFPGVKILRAERNLGYSGGLNLGLDYVFNGQQAEYALISNNDVKVDRQAISELVKVAQAEPKAGFVTGKVYYYDDPGVLQSVGKNEDPIIWNGGHIGNKETDHGQFDKVSELFFADDIYMLVKKALYDEIGGYNTLFRLEAEEYDWQARAKEKGYKIMFTPYAKLWHKVSMTIGKQSALKAYYDARNPMLVILLHKHPDFFRRYLRFHFFNDIVKSSLVSLKQGRIIVALAKWAGFFSGVAWGIKHKKLTCRHFF